jgi:CBS domain-containing protein
MRCPWCDEDNLPGADQCSNCCLDLSSLDRPTAHDRVQRSLMDDPVEVLPRQPPITMRPEASVREAITMLVRHGIGAILIVDVQGLLVGIFTERDVLLKLDFGRGDEDRPVSEFMTRRPEMIRESDSLALALHRMDCGDYRHLPIVRQGQLLGVLSIRDLLQYVTGICRG